MSWEPLTRSRYGYDRLTGAATPIPDGIELWGNDEYNVFLRELEPPDGSPLPPMVWLSISRKDRGTVRDWRHLQRIKNELVGPECEGVELFPAESRLVDTSNQYHLWVVSDPAVRFPFGYGDRLVMDPTELAAEAPSAVQRPFD